MGATYTAGALTRLALSNGVRDLVDSAMQLIPTLDDHAGSPADHLAQALGLRMQAGKVVTAAVLHARAEGLGWAGIAMYAGIKTTSVIERWEPEEQRWQDLLQRAQGTGQGAGDPGPNDPHVVFAPEAYAEDLDSWATKHLDALLIERWVAEGKDSSRPVSGGLPPTFTEREPR